MKKLLFALLVFLVTSQGFCAEHINTNAVFASTAIAASGTAYSQIIDLNNFKPDGYFSLHITAASGTGTAKIEYEISNNGTAFLEPTSASDIVLAHTVTSGPATDGKNIYSFDPEMCRYMRIKITETGGANPITISATLAIQ